MKFASVRQVIVLTAVTCIAFYVLDYYKNPQLWHSKSVALASTDKGPRLTLWMNHLCCTGCLADVPGPSAQAAPAASPGPSRS